MTCHFHNWSHTHTEYRWGMGTHYYHCLQCEQRIRFNPEIGWIKL